VATARELVGRQIAAARERRVALVIGTGVEGRLESQQALCLPACQPDGRTPPRAGQGQLTQPLMRQSHALQHSTPAQKPPHTPTNRTFTVTVFSSSTTRRPGRAEGAVAAAGARCGSCLGGGGPIGTLCCCPLASLRAGGGGGGTGSGLCPAAVDRSTLTFPAPSICTRGPADLAGGGEQALEEEGTGARSSGRVASTSSLPAAVPAAADGAAAELAGRLTGMVGASSSSPSPGVPPSAAPPLSRLPSLLSTICSSTGTEGGSGVTSSATTAQRQNNCSNTGPGTATVQQSCNQATEEAAWLLPTSSTRWTHCDRTFPSCVHSDKVTLALLGAKLCRPRCTRCASLVITTGAVSSSSPLPHASAPRAPPSCTTACCRLDGAAAGCCCSVAGAGTGACVPAGGTRAGAAVLTTSATTVLPALLATAGAAGRASKRGTGGSWRSGGRVAAGGSAMKPGRLPLACRDAKQGRSGLLATCCHDARKQ
jgi:hypothetical protein